MRHLSRWLLVVLVFAFPVFARAIALPFNMGVQDAPPGTLVPPYTFSFGPCTQGETASGCFYGDNNTGSTINTLTLYVPDTDLNGDAISGSCSTVTYSSSFGCSVTTDPDGDFVFTFTSSTGIPSIPDPGNPYGPTFEVTESGLDPSDFPDVTIASTPEPSSLLLLGTGLFGVAALCYKGFRRAGA